MYNILFTAFPIMWFALFDQEYDKDELLSEPKHFKIGLKSKSTFFLKYHMLNNYF